MENKRKLTPVAQAYQRSKVVRDALVHMGAKCMEVTEDKCGIVWERWVITTSDPASMHGHHMSLIVFATPSWWDVFRPVSAASDVEQTIKQLKRLPENASYT